MTNLMAHRTKFQKRLIAAGLKFAQSAGSIEGLGTPETRNKNGHADLGMPIRFCPDVQRIMGINAVLRRPETHQKVQSLIRDLRIGIRQAHACCGSLSRSPPRRNRLARRFG